VEREADPFDADHRFTGVETAEHGAGGPAPHIEVRVCRADAPPRGWRYFPRPATPQISPMYMQAEVRP
jgi:hypothetical protein